MIRAILTVVFMTILMWWLHIEFHKHISVTRYRAWLISAIILQALAGLVWVMFDDRVVGNFLLHAIGGGVTATLLFIYLIKTYGVSVSWRVEVVVLYCFISALGVLNELAEYAGELIVGDGSFSWDSHDTWRDLVANTSGAMLAWLVYRVIMGFAESRQASRQKS